MVRRESGAEAGLVDISIPPIQAELFWPAKLLCSEMSGSSSGAREDIRQSRLLKPTGYGSRGPPPPPSLPKGYTRERTRSARKVRFPASAVRQATAPCSKRLSPPANQLSLITAALRPAAVGEPREWHGWTALLG